MIEVDPTKPIGSIAETQALLRGDAGARVALDAAAVRTG